MTALVLALQLFLSDTFLHAGKVKLPQGNPAACAHTLLPPDQHLAVVRQELDTLIKRAPSGHRLILEVLRQGFEQRALEQCQDQGDCTREQIAAIAKQTVEKRTAPLNNTKQLNRLKGYSLIAVPVVVSLLLSTLWMHSLPDHPSATQQFISELIHLGNTLVAFAFGAALTKRIMAKTERASFRTLDPSPMPSGAVLHSLTGPLYDVDVELERTLDENERKALFALMTAASTLDSGFYRTCLIISKAKSGELSREDLKFAADQMTSVLLDLRILNPAIAPEHPYLMDRARASLTDHSRYDLRAQLYPKILERLKARDPDARDSQEVFEYYKRMLRGLLFLPEETIP